MENDYALEKAAIQRLQKSIILCDSLGDAGSSDLLEHILLDEERHANDQESFLQQIKDMGIENFLTTQFQPKGEIITSISAVESTPLIFSLARRGEHEEG